MPFLGSGTLQPSPGKNQLSWASLVAQMVKNLPAVQKTGSIPGIRKIPWKTEWQRSSVIAWIILWTEEPGGPQSMGSQRHNLATNTFTFSLFNL